jgi:phenylalanyl-tRNA synthetase beta subunit
MRAPDRTLSAAEVAEVRQNALASAEEKCGAALRA